MHGGVGILAESVSIKSERSDRVRDIVLEDRIVILGNMIWYCIKMQHCTASRPNLPKPQFITP